MYIWHSSYVLGVVCNMCVCIVVDGSLTQFKTEGDFIPSAFLLGS